MLTLKRELNKEGKKMTDKRDVHAPQKRASVKIQAAEGSSGTAPSDDEILS